MIVDHYLQIAPLINDCPNCKNGYVGGGQGTLVVDEQLIRRTCKCGYQFEYVVTNTVDIEALDAEIKESVKRFRNEGEQP